MTKVNLNRDSHEIISGNDDFVIVNALGDIPGGRSLDCTGFTGVIKAGHVIIVSGTGVYKPMPVNGSSYDSLPASHGYVGVLKATVSVKDARAAIVTIGQVNEAACPYPITDGIKAGLPLIQWLYNPS